MSAQRCGNVVSIIADSIRILNIERPQQAGSKNWMRNYLKNEGMGEGI